MGRLKTVFLDADGVLSEAIIVDGKPRAPTELDQLKIFSDAKAALGRLKAAGYFLVCVTNKPDVERGWMTQETVDAIYKEMRNQLPLDDLFVAYHEGAPDYKPAPGMLLGAAKKHDIDLENSFMVGDRNTDIEAGQNAGCKTVWINRHYGVNPAPEPSANFTADSLSEMVDWILEE